jgi:hypothetical protein
VWYVDQVAKFMEEIDNRRPSFPRFLAKEFSALMADVCDEMLLGTPIGRKLTGVKLPGAELIVDSLEKRQQLDSKWGFSTTNASAMAEMQLDGNKIGHGQIDESKCGSMYIANVDFANIGKAGPELTSSFIGPGGRLA